MLKLRIERDEDDSEKTIFDEEVTSEDRESFEMPTQWTYEDFGYCGDRGSGSYISLWIKGRTYPKDSSGGMTPRQKADKATKKDGHILHGVAITAGMSDTSGSGIVIKQTVVFWDANDLKRLGFKEVEYMPPDKLEIIRECVSGIGA